VKDRCEHAGKNLEQKKINHYLKNAQKGSCRFWVYFLSFFQLAENSTLCFLSFVIPGAAYFTSSYCVKNGPPMKPGPGFVKIKTELLPWKNSIQKNWATSVI
jgi:hypothetical protein